MKELTTHANAASYDVAAEAARVAYPDVVIGERRINRANASVNMTGPLETEALARVRGDWTERLFPTTLPDDAPVIELGWPTTGPFVSSPHGTYFDTYLAVAQKVLDENHPRFVQMLRDLETAGATLRREIVTDDYIASDPEGLVKTPTDLARLWEDAMQARWPIDRGYGAFFSSSGAESVEASLKLAYVSAYKRFLKTFGMATFERVMAELGIPKVPYFDADPGLPGEPVFDDYPFHVVACDGAFHGRTMGALSMTWSKKAHRLGFPRARTVHHIPYNAEGDALRDLIDWRGIEELLETPGELRRVVDQGRIPKDLFAAFAAEPFQGEGGYVPGDPTFFGAVRAVCDETGAMLIVDEVQSIARTGRLFMTERLGIRPDMICTAKSMVLGVTLAPRSLGDDCHVGWHSNTWGAGRVLDTNFAYHTLDTLLHHKDPVFGGLSYLENEEVKGDYLAAGFDRLVEKHPDLLMGHRGYGLMRALLVKDRSAIEKAGWRHGVKLLGCGWNADVAPIRILMLADTLGREVDELLRVLDLVLTDVGSGD